MRKTYCDACGNEVKTVHVALHGEVMHLTSKAEIVGEDHIPTIDLCASCLADVQKIIPLRVVGPETDSCQMVGEAPVRDYVR
jgi:hypothetical protein